MDLRKKRTRNSIINAFIQLRAKKPLEKITVKELSELAMINKATFYQHYADIYALSEELETEALETLLKDLYPEGPLHPSRQTTLKLYESILAQGELFFILFSGSRQAVFLDRLEQRIKEEICARYPEYKNNLEFDVLMTVLIQGCSHAFLNYKNDRTDTIINILAEISCRLLPARD